MHHCILCLHEEASACGALQFASNPWTVALYQLKKPLAGASAAAAAAASAATTGAAASASASATSAGLPPKVMTRASRPADVLAAGLFAVCSLSLMPSSKLTECRALD